MTTKMANHHRHYRLIFSFAGFKKVVSAMIEVTVITTTTTATTSSGLITTTILFGFCYYTYLSLSFLVFQSFLPTSVTTISSNTRPAIPPAKTPANVEEITFSLQSAPV